MIRSLLKRGVVAVLPALSTFTNSSSMQFSSVINGSYNVSHRVILDKMYVNGEAKLGAGTSVQESFTVNGTLQANYTTFQSELVANGPATLRQCSLKDTGHFSGSVNAISSQFFKEVTLRSNTANFADCTLDNVTVLKNPYNTKQVVKLQKGSVIMGNLTFESGNGEVILDESSQVNGMVFGGTKSTR